MRTRRGIWNSEVVNKAAIMPGKSGFRPVDTVIPGQSNSSAHMSGRNSGEISAENEQALSGHRRDFLVRGSHAFFL